MYFKVGQPELATEEVWRGWGVCVGGGVQMRPSLGLTGWENGGLSFGMGQLAVTEQVSSQKMTRKNSDSRHRGPWILIQ